MSQDRGFSPSRCRPTPEITKLYDTKTLILVRKRLILMSRTGGSDIRKPRKRWNLRVRRRRLPKWGLRDLRQDPLLPRASFSMKCHPVPSPVQENSLGRRAGHVLLFGRPTTYPKGTPVPLWGSSTPLGLQFPIGAPDFDAREQYRRSPAENSWIKFSIPCILQPSSEKIALPSPTSIPMTQS